MKYILGFLLGLTAFISFMILISVHKIDIRIYYKNSTVPAHFKVWALGEPKYIDPFEKRDTIGVSYAIRDADDFIIK